MKNRAAPRSGIAMSSDRPASIPGVPRTPSGGDVIASAVLTESGTELGTVVEVVIETGDRADVVGFEIEAVEGLRPGDDHHVFIPLPDTLAISGDNIIVPDSARDFVRDDLTGFGGAVADFRSQLGEEA